MTDSWIPVDPSSHFSLDNLPFGIASHPATGPDRFGATRIGDTVVNLAALEAAGFLAGALPADGETYFNKPTLNSFASLPSPTRLALRHTLQSLFALPSPLPNLLSPHLLPLASVTLHLPFTIPDFSDFSVFPAHALGAGRAIFGPDTPMPPSFPALPMGYNGRAGTVSLEERVVRPRGQKRAFSAGREVSVGACEALDWEFEIGAFVSRPTAAGTSLTPAEAQDHIFGNVLLNDWSARDIQAFEMVPLGPYNGKSFATTISPWVVVPEALQSAAVAPPPRIQGGAFVQPEHLKEAAGARTGFNLDCQTSFILASDPSAVHALSRARFADAYWSFPQLLAHQTFSGALVQTGDLLGSGTISSEGAGAQGCMLEMAQGGKAPVKVGPDGAERRWIEDGDTVVFSATVAGRKGVGFGELRGTVLPALE